MSILQLKILIIVGVVAGLLSGAFGTGAAIIVIPSLVFILGLSQHKVLGTNLAFKIPQSGIPAKRN